MSESKKYKARKPTTSTTPFAEAEQLLFCVPYNKTKVYTTVYLYASKALADTARKENGLSATCTAFVSSTDGLPTHITHVQYDAKDGTVYVPSVNQVMRLLAKGGLPIPDVINGVNVAMYLQGSASEDMLDAMRYAYAGTITGQISSSTPSFASLPKSPKKATPFFDDILSTNTTKENPMNQALKITTRTYVNDRPLDGMPKADIYNLIAEQEARIRDLEAIQNKPKMLSDEISERKAGIQALVNYLDSKPA